jgi:hypothetical protein
MYRFLVPETFLRVAQTASGAHAASYPMGTGRCSLGSKTGRREADHSPPSSAEVNKYVDLHLHP